MRKFSPLQQEIIRCIVAQPIGSMTNFDLVLKSHFFNDKYNLAFAYGKEKGIEMAILYVKKINDEMKRIHVCKFLEVVSLLKYLKDEGLIYLLFENVTLVKDFFVLIHEDWDSSSLVLNKDGLHLNISDHSVRDINGNEIYTSLALPHEYYNWALQYLNNGVYSTEDLKKLVERNFVTEAEESLQIAHDSLEKTEESLILTKESLEKTKVSLKWTKFAFYISCGAFLVSVIASLISAFSYKWSDSTITSKQFDVMEQRNEKLIKSMRDNTKIICDELDSVNRNVLLKVSQKEHNVGE